MKAIEAPNELQMFVSARKHTSYIYYCAFSTIDGKLKVPSKFPGGDVCLYIYANIKRFIFDAPQALQLANFIYLCTSTYLLCLQSANSFILKRRNK